MHPIVVKISEKQKSRLRNGHRVRVKKAEMQGEGVFVIVNPMNYDLVTRSFKKSRGAEISLSPEEIQVNKSLSPEQQQEIIKDSEISADMVGQGIFGKKFDRFTRKVLGKKGNKLLGKIAKKVLLPIAKTGLDAATAALVASNPELAPIAPSLNKMGKKYLENPQKYQKDPSKIATETAKDIALKQLNEQLGTNMGNIRSAVIGSADANAASAELANRAVQAPTVLTSGNGLYAGGNGLYAGSRGGYGLYSGMRRSLATVGAGGRIMSNVHPATQSQPYAENFQFGSTLPVAYQKLRK
jgi:hypothetical protein